MRIALVSDVFLPRLGGIEVQVDRLARGLVSAGHEVVVLTITPGAQADVVEGGVQVLRFALPVGLPGSVVVNPAGAGWLRSVLGEGGFDVVHVHMGVVSPFAFDAVQVAAQLGLAHVVTCHSLVGGAGRLWLRLSGRVDRWVCGGAVLSAVSGVAAQRLAAAACGDVEVEVVPNGVDRQVWRRRCGGRTRAGGVRVVSAMRLSRIKRPVALLELVRVARGLVPGVPITVEVAGDGPLRPVCERWVRRHGAGGWVRLRGRLSHEELVQMYGGADVFVSPVVDEAFGIAALEARACGVPVFGRVGSGVGEFVRSGVDGVLMDSDVGLARAVARCAVDGGWVARLREQAGVELPERFGQGAVVAGAVGLYERAVRGV
ncbi:glycosyltransferase family 4 protein [Dermatophilus congolensis]|uniref:D-inositol 3-phosphate glycosyltransferase n=13 Tax=Dermatophilus congolensis TaxID=1863 RepID=A0A239VBM9_9MICO|nr:glycosyltransferase [Dermatophilus congolensis]MBO3157686.1 glycosyltransferase family 4 protein [Dermatophilus congolensis]MBO3189259.1 glycosyltransferase family 4 protein [Dermatophilus congolensis]SNV19575.1 Glycogen synthase [Dermatophilus congolensis]